MARVILGGEYAPAVRPDWTPVKPDFDTIPQELRAMPCAVFVLEPRPNGKWGKQQRNCQGYPLSPKQPEKWPTFAECRQADEAGLFDGVGVRLDGSIIAVDIDDIDKGLPPEIAVLVDRAIDEGIFTGKTVSGNGIRIICKGTMTPNGRRKGQVEIYKDLRFISLPRGKGEIKEAQWLVDGVLSWIEGEAVQGEALGPDKTGKGPSAGEVAPATLDRIERAGRATLGADVERMRGKYSSDFGDSGTDDPSGQVYKAACCVGRKGLEAGVLADEDTLTGVIHEVTGRFPVTDEWVDASGSKWARLGETTARKAARAVLKEWTGAKAGKVDGDQGEEWPLPDDVNFSLPAVPEFDPYEMLPPVLADYVADHAELLQVPPEVIASQVVVAMGAVIGNRVGVMPKRNDSTWVEVPNLWNFVVMPPGHKKSPAQQRALAPLRQCERLLEERHKKRLAEYEVELIQHKVKRALWEKGVKEGTATAADKPPDPEEPREARLIVGDSTMAKLEEQLRDSLHGLMLERDEMAGLWSALNRPEAAGDKEKYLTMANGHSQLKTDRIGRGSIIIPMATLSMVGGTQPGKLARAVRDAVKGETGADGWIQRYLMAVYPDSDKPYIHVDRKPNLEAQEGLFNRTRELFDLDPVAIGAKQYLGSSLYCLKLTNEAQDGFDSWIVALETLLRSGNLHPALESHFSKYRGLIPKLSLIFHLVEDGAGPITLDALYLAIKWQVFLQAHARRIYAGLLRGADLATKNLADRIRAGRVPDGFKARDIRLKGWAGLTDKEDVDNAIEGLLEAHWLREERISGNGRPTRRFLINPKIIQPKP